MRSFKLVLALSDGSRLWINPNHIVKMVRTPNDRYFIYLSSGETYEIDHGSARNVEEFLED